MPVREVLVPPVIVIGKTLGHYAVRERLGSGGMGDVYLAEDGKLGREVALKVLPPEMAGSGERRRRFEREARAVAALNHPNIVTIHAVEEQEGILFLVMERVRGASLRELLREGPLPGKRSVEIGIQIAEALDAAHAAGILHRDLKPDNVMVSPEGRVKLLDFGLAKLLRPSSIDASIDSEAGTMARETSPGMTLGTAGYMAPEQALGRDVDVRADLFALGVVLYEMATAKSPFAGETLAAFFDSLLNRPPAPPRLANPGLSPELAKVLEKALEKEPARRYQSTDELLSDLRRIESGGTLPAERRVQASIAVLPFRDLSPEKNQEYFCQGLAEELINTLASNRGLRVTARTSAFALRGQGLDVQEIGRRLGVATVLEGSVRKQEARIRVTVQLADAADGRQVWSKRFDRELDDVFAIQEDIAESIASELRSELGFSKERGHARRASNVEAFDAYLRGLYARGRWTEEWVDRAIACFEEAVERDPSYALAHAGIAECLVWFYSGIGTRKAAATIPRARQAAERALALEPGLAEAHKAAAFIAMSHDWDRARAKEHFLRALELNPGSAGFRVGNAWRIALLEGSYEEALSELQAAEALDPLDLMIKTQIGYVYYFLRDFDRALAQFERVVALDPHFAFAHYALGDVRAQRGDASGAIEAIEESIRLGGVSVNHTGVLAYAHALAGREPEARRLLQRILDQASPMWIALAYLGLGEVEAMFQWLERGFQERDGSLVLLTATPEFDPVRGDPRFRDLLDRMGLAHRASARR